MLGGSKEVMATVYGGYNLMHVLLLFYNMQPYIFDLVEGKVSFSQKFFQNWV